MKKTVVVGMSGGVDSSVAAKLLIDGGYNAVGLFMRNWDEDDGGECTAAADWRDAQAVCGKLGIPCYSVNFAKEYRQSVFDSFLDEYRAGRTPNPDVLCNREIKFGPFASYAKKLGADYIATGHYCGILHGAPGGARLLKAADANKDQTYFLNAVRTEQLNGVLFPLADLTKSAVRAIAEKCGLPTAKKRDSTGVCFIGERDFKRFLQNYLPNKKGNIVDKSGNVLGVHDGLMYYTPGQRRGLNIGGVRGCGAGRWYVTDKRPDTNELVVSNGEGGELFSRSLECGPINIIGADGFGDKFACTAKTRYRQSEQNAVVTRTAVGASVEFEKPQRAVTPGQYVVFYVGNRCLGGAVINSVGR
ncbi:MAG: tRNA 2-thiouridine(34) synthase MnmA [Clostridiales bacterium]|jgi:tRNA-specific 2-thiouridylase|nr:tRNA 2-thiouridine(34) synthase MnmA [Clostridiales bacterium]